jgi:aryl-alcohol dehydrogenase-like predicted oxidoreductase
MAWRYADKLNLIGPLMEQPQYNMLAREKVESEFALLYEQTGLGLTIFSPLKIGILTGKYNDEIPSDSRLGSSNDNFVKNFKSTRLGDESWKKDIVTVKKLAPVAERLGVKQATLALAWVLKNKNVSSAITGASRPEQIYESVKAFKAVELLTDEVMAEIDTILDNKPAALIRRFL